MCERLATTITGRDTRCATTLLHLALHGIAAPELASAPPAAQARCSPPKGRSTSPGNKTQRAVVASGQ